MNDRPANFDELRSLLTELTDGELTAAQRERLNGLVSTDDDAARFYADYLAIHAGLLFEPAAVSIAPPASDPEDAPAPAIPIYRKGCEPKPAISNFQFSIFHFQFQLIAAALLAACGLAVYVFVSSLPQSEFPDPTSSAPLATLIENSGEGTLTTPGGFISEGRDYPPGEYALSSGRAEFMLTNSVNVRLRGETRLHMRNNMRVALNQGAAEFVVPPDASGFTVLTPDGARVIDLGTRFVVSVGSDGRSRLGVVEGSVRLVRDGDDTRSGIDRILTTGDALILADTGHTPAHLTPGGVVVESVTVDPIVFNAASNDTERGDEAPGLAESFAHSAFVDPRIAPEAAFGRSDTPIERGIVMFANHGEADNGNAAIGDGDEAVDHLAWTTREPVTLGGYRVELRGDGPALGAPRTAQMVRLVIDDRTVDTFDADGRSGEFLRLFDAGPITGTRFRIELTRTVEAGDAAGPRIVEIDAVNVTAPAALNPDQRIAIPPTRLDEVGIVAHPVSGDSR